MKIAKNVVVHPIKFRDVQYYSVQTKFQDDMGSGSQAILLTKEQVLTLIDTLELTLADVEDRPPCTVI